MKVKEKVCCNPSTTLNIPSSQNYRDQSTNSYNKIVRNFYKSLKPSPISNINYTKQLKIKAKVSILEENFLCDSQTSSWNNKTTQIESFHSFLFKDNSHFVSKKNSLLLKSTLLKYFATSGRLKVSSMALLCNMWSP